MPPITEKNSLPKKSTAPAKPPLAKAQVKPSAPVSTKVAQPQASLSPSHDRVILGERPINPGAAADKDLAAFARTNKNSNAGQGTFNWGNADGLVKILGGFTNMKKGVEHIYAGETGTGAMELTTGAMDSAGAGSHFGAKLFSSASVLGKLKTLGTISEYGGFGLSAIGTAVSAYETVDGLRTGNEVKAVEKGLDTAAGAASTFAGIPGAGTAVAELAASTSSATAAFGTCALTALAGCAAAAGMGYSVGRLIGSSTGLDGKVESYFSNNMFKEDRNYAHQNKLDVCAGDFAQSLNDGDLQRLAQKNSDIFAQSITGTLTEIENARTSGDKEALSQAQRELSRLRDAQHGRLI